MLIAYEIFMVNPKKTIPNWRGIDPIFIDTNSFDGFKKNEKITPKIIDNTALDVRKITTIDSNKKKKSMLI